MKERIRDTCLFISYGLSRAVDTRQTMEEALFNLRSSKPSRFGTCLCLFHERPERQVKRGNLWKERSIIIPLPNPGANFQTYRKGAEHIIHKTFLKNALESNTTKRVLGAVVAISTQEDFV